MNYILPLVLKKMIEGKTFFFSNFGENKNTQILILVTPFFDSGYANFFELFRTI